MKIHRPPLDYESAAIGASNPKPRRFVMLTAAELATKIDQLRADLAINEATTKTHRDALKLLIAERDRITAEIAANKKARFSAIAAEEKAAKIAALKAELAKLEADDVSEPTPILSLVA